MIHSESNTRQYPILIIRYKDSEVLEINVRNWIVILLFNPSWYLAILDDTNNNQQNPAKFYKYIKLYLYSMILGDTYTIQNDTQQLTWYNFCGLHTKKLLHCAPVTLSPKKREKYNDLKSYQTYWTKTK